MNEFKEVLNSNLDSYELYRRLNNEKEYIIFHINIVKYVLDREGINYEVRPYDKYTPIELEAVIMFNSYRFRFGFDIYYSICNNSIMMQNCLGYFFKINKETIYQELKEFLLNERI